MTRVVGLVSGTSVDAIDVAVVDLEVADDVLELELVGIDEVPFPAELRADVLAALPPATTTLREVCRLHARLGDAFATAAAAACHATGTEAAVVALLGQTLYHDVVDGAVVGTLQLGDPARVAERTGLPVVSDLRVRDVAAGGHGAPLVSRLDELLLAAPAREHPVAACNLGGIANLTVVTDGQPTIAFDCGPANALLDVAARRLLGADRDDDGRVAAAGRIDRGLRAALLDDPYLAAPPPKTTGKERYNARYLDDVLASAPVQEPADVLLTLADAVATAVADDVARHGVRRVWASGGGVHNAALMARLRHHLAAVGTASATTDDLGIPSDAKEAIAVALLGWCTWVGRPGNVPTCTGATGPRLLGSITPGTAPLRPPPSSQPPALRSLRVRA